MANAPVQDAAVHFVSVTYNEEDANKTDWELLEIARESCRLRTATVSSVELEVEQALIMSFRVEGQFTTRDEIYDAAEQRIIRLQQQVNQGAASPINHSVLFP